MNDTSIQTFSELALLMKICEQKQGLRVFITYDNKRLYWIIVKYKKIKHPRNI